MKLKVEQFCSDAAGDESWQLEVVKGPKHQQLIKKQSQLYSVWVCVCVLASCTEELVASELLKQDFPNLKVRSKDSAHASRRTVKISR